MHSLDDIMGAAPAADNMAGASPAEVLAGKTFWSLRTNSAWGPQTGSMPDNGAVTYTPDTTDQPVAAGYHNGSGYVAGDADLVPGNIIDDVSIFDVTGTYPLAPVPSTGVTLCYTTTDTSATPCPAEGYPGQDGEYQKGVDWPNPRFTANVDNNGDGDCQDPGETCDGTVTDNLTGLIWLKNANCFGLRTWTQALNDADTLNHLECDLADGSNQGDWRLPNIRELHSLIHYGLFGPAVPNTEGTGQWSEGDPFIDVQLFLYWSSTTDAFNPTIAWFMVPRYGEVDYDAKTFTGHVWPVRGGQ
jgi:hypothetical protein